MARGKGRRKRRMVAPSSAAGLITYFEEEAGGIKLRPEIVIAMAMGLIVSVIMAHLVAPVLP